MTESRKVKLSFEKFDLLLQKYNYIFSSAYCEEDCVRFIECRSPRQQKTFMIYFPEKYQMILPPNKKKTSIFSSDFSPNQRQIEFISEMKGPLLTCDIALISSEIICMYQDNDRIKCFNFGEDEEIEEDIEEEYVEDEKDNAVTSLEKDVLGMLKEIKGPEATLPTINLDLKDKNKLPEHHEPHKDDANSNDQEEDESSDNEVELIFEDGNGDIVDEVTTQLDDELKDGEKFKGKIEDDDDLPCQLDNSIPPKLEEEEIVIGIVYVVIDIGTFFRTASTYEENIIKCYDQIEENELELRHKKYETIRDLVQKFLLCSDARLKKIAEDEKILKTQLIRLTVVLTQATLLKNRVSTDPTKYGDLVDEINRIYNQTRSTIYNLNIERLKLRDTADELLSDYQSSISDLIDM